MGYEYGENFLGEYYDYYSNLNAHQVAPEYSSSATYAVGDYCIYETVLYKCTTAITTAEAWNSAHWTAEKLAKGVSQIEEDFRELGLSVVDGAINVAYTP